MTNKKHLQTLLQNHTRRLQLLKEQQSKTGYDTKPEIILEIQDLQHQISQIQTQLNPPTGVQREALNQPIGVQSEALGQPTGVQSEALGQPTGVQSETLNQPPKTPHQPLPDPFGDVGRIETPTTYLIRQPITHQMLTELSKGSSLSLVGDSGVGKSSLLWYICHHGPQYLNRPPTDFIYLTLELVSSEEDLFQYLCDELSIPFARGLRLTRHLKNRKIILCLDEAEKLTTLPPHLRSELRGLADGPSTPFTLILSSRSPLSRLFPDDPTHTSPLSSLCYPFTLPPFTLAESYALVEHHLAPHGQTMPPNLVEQAWHQTNGHPARLQQTLRQIYRSITADR